MQRRQTAFSWQRHAWLAWLVVGGGLVAAGYELPYINWQGNARHRWITPHVHLEVWRDGEAIDPATLGLEVTPPRGGGDGEQERARGGPPPARGTEPDAPDQDAH